LGRSKTTAHYYYSPARLEEWRGNGGEECTNGIKKGGPRTDVKGGRAVGRREKKCSVGASEQKGEQKASGTRNGDKDIFRSGGEKHVKGRKKKRIRESG